MSVRFLEDLSVDGNVGIGTTSPSSTLTINQTNDNGIKLIGYDDRDDASANIYIDSGGHLKINNTNGSASGYIIIEAENYLNLRANSFVYFTSNVRVYDSNAFGFGSGNDLIIQHDGSHSYISQSGTGNLYIQQNTNDADMVFQCDDGSGGTTAYLTLDGSVGYMIASKAIRALDGVNFQLGASADFTMQHNGVNTILQNYTGNLEITQEADDGGIVFKSDDGSGGTTAYLTLDGSTTHSYFSAGNVGIGTSSPDTLLEVSNSTGAAVRITSTATGNGADVTLGSLEYYGNDASVPGAGIKSSIVAKTEASLGDDSNLIFSTSDGTTNNIERLRINSSGNVGIGTTSPVGKLTIIDTSASSTNQKFHVGRATNAGLYITDDDSTAYIKSIQDENAAGYGNLTLMADDAGSRDGYISFNHSDTGEKMRITNGGNVGIGTTSPGEKLEVAGNAIINGDLTVTSGTSGDATLIISADTDNSEEGDSPRLWFKADGDITQGAIQHNDNTFDFISNVSSNGGFKFLTGTTNNTGTTDPSTGATERVSIDSTGITISGSIQLGHASDTTIARASAGKVTIEGAPIQTTQMSMSHHNFYFNTTSTTVDYFVPFNNLTESSNPTTTNYYGRMVAPYDGRIVKAVINTTAAIGTACSAQFWVATSSGTFAPSPAETVSNINLNTANTAATATFSGTSTAEFSEGDVVGLSIQKSGTTSTAYIQVTIVWEYTV